MPPRERYGSICMIGTPPESEEAAATVAAGGERAAATSSHPVQCQSGQARLGACYIIFALGLLRCLLLLSQVTPSHSVFNALFPAPSSCSPTRPCPLPDASRRTPPTSSPACPHSRPLLLHRPSSRVSIPVHLASSSSSRPQRPAPTSPRYAALQPQVRTQTRMFHMRTRFLHQRPSRPSYTRPYWRAQPQVSLPRLRDPLFTPG